MQAFLNILEHARGQDKDKSIYSAEEKVIRSPWQCDETIGEFTRLHHISVSMESIVSMKSDNLPAAGFRLCTGTMRNNIESLSWLNVLLPCCKAATAAAWSLSCLPTGNPCTVKIAQNTHINPKSNIFIRTNLNFPECQLVTNLIKCSWVMCDSPLYRDLNTQLNNHSCMYLSYYL